MDGMDLEGLRAQLDEVDAGLVDLIARRLEIVAGVGAAKADTDHPVRDPERERIVLDKVAAAAEERGVSGDLVRRIYREIIGHAVDKQVASLVGGPERPAVIGFQGASFAYSHLAARKHFEARGWEATYRGYRDFAVVIDELVSGAVDLAVLPVENTTAGSINQVYDLLQSSPVHVVGEETWRVDHAIAAIADVPLMDLTQVHSHQQGLEQCAAFLRTLNAAPTVAYDTAGAMRSVAENGNPTWAAIGPPEAAEAAGLVILRQGITDQAENFTRFLVLSREPAVVAPRVPSKTSLVIITRHEEGALLRCLELLATSQHSMTKLESRPRPGRPFEYLFFLDFEGNLADPRTKKVIEDLRSAALAVKVLGSYPAKVVRLDAPEADEFEAVLAHD
jgi:chorismate mutase/prephenate dehydratase